VAIQSQNRYPAPSSWEELEQMVNDISINLFPNMVVERYGRQGQNQRGIDILVYNNTGSSIGIQCKNVNKLTKPMIDTIINNIQIPVQHIIIAVSVQRDVKLIDYVIKKSNEKLLIQILFWEDIISYLATYSLLSKYYPEFFGDDFRKTKDRELFDEFHIDFVNSGLRNYFSNLVAISRFNNDKMSLFFQVVDKWSDVNYMFHHPEIEMLRNSLMDIANSLATEIAVNTWDDERDFDYNTIPKEWITQQPDRYDKVVARIDEKLSIFRYYLGAMIFQGKQYNLL
jgi:hypothetical protein